MKLKLLLTICLLLITSQVFAKKITLYSCSTETDARSCNNCKKLGYMNIKVNVNTNKVLLQYPESTTNRHLQTVKHEDTNMLGSEIMSFNFRDKETLNVFDEDNWEYLHTRHIVHAGSHDLTFMMEIKKRMVNSKFYQSYRGADPTPDYGCGK